MRVASREQTPDDCGMYVLTLCVLGVSVVKILSVVRILHACRTTEAQ